MHVFRFLPASIRRAFAILWFHVRGVCGETPFTFFGVVLGLALAFRVGVGWLHAPPDPVAPVFVTSEPAASASSGSAATPIPTSTSTAEVGAAGRVEPLGAPARLPPRPRGHGRRPALH